MSKMYAFVEFERKRQAQKCYDKANGLVVDEHRILVDWEFGRTLKNWVPRRLGQFTNQENIFSVFILVSLDQLM
jgi:RNA recognition motif-containing protein